jgi:prepilin-type N-terminal cleavage/methylation domain-containing protein
MPDGAGRLTVMRRRLAAIRSDQSGFTLVELLASMMIGLIVLMAAFLLLDQATSVSKEVANRQEALQRGRIAMETIVRDLRSQVCLGDETEPITVAQNDKVTFYIDLSDGSKDIQQRTIRYEPTEKRLYEDIYIGTGVYPELVFNTISETRLLASNVERILDNGVPRPIFRYYAFNLGGAPGDLEGPLPTPLVPNDAIRTVLVKIGFSVNPDRLSPKTREATSVESDVYVRIADPSRPVEGPQCL